MPYKVMIDHTIEFASVKGEHIDPTQTCLFHTCSYNLSTFSHSSSTIEWHNSVI